MTTTQEKKAPRDSIEKRLISVGVVLLVCGGGWWYTNPIRLHQKVQVEGVTVRVPFGWVARMPTQDDITQSVTLSRAYIPFLPPPGIRVSIGRGFWGGQTLTKETAERYQAVALGSFADSRYYSNQGLVDFSAGKYDSRCAEATALGGYQELSCCVVGTPLWVRFYGPGTVERAAQKILASLE